MSRPIENRNFNDVAADQLPPQRIDAERSVISACLTDNGVIDEIMLVMEYEDFYRDSHQIIGRAIFEMRSEGRKVDALTLDNELFARGESERTGGIDTISEIITAIPWNGPGHAVIVHDAAVARRYIAASHEIIRAAYSGSFDSEGLAEFAEAAIFKAADQRHNSNIVTSQEAVAEAMAALDRRRVNREPVGMNTGLDGLDAVLNGVDGSQLVIVGGRPSQGKTALCLQWADHITTEYRRSVLFVSLEMVRGELADRLLSAKSGIDGQKIRMASVLTSGEMLKIDTAASSFHGLPPILFDDTSSLTANQIASTARRCKSKYDIAAVFVDYIQIVDTSGDGDSGTRQEEVARVCRRMKTLARELNIPVIVLAQLNRASEMRTGQRPRLADLKESGQLEQDAHSVLLVHRPSFYDANDMPGQAEIIVAKNRNGQTGLVRVDFRGNLTRFDDLDRQPQIEGPEF
jgi:replicative DNA helicase